MDKENIYVMRVNSKFPAVAAVPLGKDPPVRTELEAGWTSVSA